MKKREQGLTLIEVLAAIVILSIILLITFNILNEATRSHQSQMKNNEELFQATYLLKVITKDARRTNAFEKSDTNPATFKFYRSENSPVSNLLEVVYTFNGNQVIREATTWDAATKTELSKEVNIFANLQAFYIEDCQTACENSEDRDYLTVSFHQGEESFSTNISLRKENTR